MGHKSTLKMAAEPLSETNRKVMKLAKS